MDSVDDRTANQSELSLAHGVQQVLFPKGSPVCRWNCTGVKNRMAREVGGDYFDFITLGDGCELIFIGDVTGHGLHASLIMGLLYGFIHRSAAEGCDPLRLMREVNSFLRLFARRSETYDHFFSTTLFVGIIDPKSLKMHYINAGQVAPMVRSGEHVELLQATAPPLGYFDLPELTVHRYSFEPGNRLLLVTDGITEATNTAGSMFGQEELLQILIRHRGDHLDFLDTIFQRLAQFGVSEPPEDDCTAIVMDLHGSFARKG